MGDPDRAKAAMTSMLASASRCTCTIPQGSGFYSDLARGRVMRSRFGVRGIRGEVGGLLGDPKEDSPGDPLEDRGGGTSTCFK